MFDTKIQDLIGRGAIFYVSHSGGKDSQAMYIHLLANGIPNDQVVVVHADLGEIEWTGVHAHIVDTVAHEVNVVHASKTFFEMVERRYENRPEVPCWPSSATRQCTSDLKRGPIHKFIRHDMKARESLLSVNCTGIRAAESNARAKKNPFTLSKTLSKAGREVYEWMPIFDWSTEKVFASIAQAGQEPFWAYEKNERLSCVFCIMGCKNDLRHGAEHRPELFSKYVEIEKRTGWTMFQGQTLEEKTGITVNELAGIPVVVNHGPNDKGLPSPLRRQAN